MMCAALSDYIEWENRPPPIRKMFPFGRMHPAAGKRLPRQRPAATSFRAWRAVSDCPQREKRRVTG